MLRSVTIRNFKSYRDATLPLAPLTVLIGANASGKSNAIEAMRLLSWIAQGNRLTSIRYAVYEGDQAVRGTVPSLPFRGEDTFTFAVSTADSEWDEFQITLKTNETDLQIIDEKISDSRKKEFLYAVSVNSGRLNGDIIVNYKSFAGRKRTKIVCNDQMAIFLQLLGSARFRDGDNVAQKIIPVVCDLYARWLSNIIILDPQPSAMRNYSFKTEKRLIGDGRNLSGVLYNLIHSGDCYNEILSIVKCLPEQNINDIVFAETTRGEVMVELVEKLGEKIEYFDASLLSDGTLRVLSVAVALLSAPEGSLVVIEEIDNGVHPSRASTLLDSISRIAKRRRLNVLISSHNPALLDALPDDAVGDVVFCYRDPADGSSRLVRLSDVPDYPELIAQGSVGHLMTRGVIDRFVKQHPGPDAKRRQALSWLESLRHGTGGE